MADPDPTPQDTPDSDIRLESVTKRFAETLAVDDLSLEIERGELLRDAGPIRLRQDDDAADDRGL